MGGYPAKFLELPWDPYIYSYDFFCLRWCLFECFYYYSQLLDLCVHLILYSISICSLKRSQKNGRQNIPVLVRLEYVISRTKSISIIGTPGSLAYASSEVRLYLFYSYVLIDLSQLQPTYIIFKDFYVPIHHIFLSFSLRQIPVLLRYTIFPTQYSYLTQL